MSQLLSAPLQSGVRFLQLPLSGAFIGKNVFANVFQELMKDMEEDQEVDALGRVLLVDLSNVLTNGFGHIGDPSRGSAEQFWHREHQRVRGWAS